MGTPTILPDSTPNSTLFQDVSQHAAPQV